MKLIRTAVVSGALLVAAPLIGKAGSPFVVVPSRQATNGSLVVRVAFEVPPNHFLYRDKLSLEVDGRPVAFTMPEPTLVTDKFSGEQKEVFARSFEAIGTLPAATPTRVVLKVHLQGCDDANCFFPEDGVFALGADGTSTQMDGAALASRSNPTADWRALVDDFTVAARGSGYLNEQAFLDFLSRAESGRGAAVAARPGRTDGLFVALVLIVLGGLGLNLTPCVLPLIPINLAIIGAGAQASSRRRGFALGATYAAGMAVAYGLLGSIVVLTGSKFGTLNSKPWFNLVVAIIFGGLGLCMFDVFALDFSRFQSRAGGGMVGARGKFFVALTMGSLAALLAGACVAPVVISVLVQATTFYNRGVTLGLALPFLLGLGMGLPWPFAGAGLSFLPKPGIWMNRVKYGFGVMIFLLGGYYAWLAYGLWHTTRVADLAATNTADASAAQLSHALDQARAEGKPVFIDFWASWCKNCSAMEHTTFRASAVRKQLGDYVQVRLRAEHPNEPPAKDLLDRFGALGLPTYVVLMPKTVSKGDRS